MTSLIFTALCLACHRLSLLLTKEDGPAWIFRKIRNLPKKGTSLDKGIECLWCASVWFAAPLAAWACWMGFAPWAEWPLWWLAVSSGGICVNQAFTKG